MIAGIEFRDDFDSFQHDGTTYYERDEFIYNVDGRTIGLISGRGSRYLWIAYEEAEPEGGPLSILVPEGPAFSEHIQNGISFIDIEPTLVEIARGEGQYGPMAVDPENAGHEVDPHEGHDPAMAKLLEARSNA